VIGEDGQGRRVTRDAADILQGVFGRDVTITVSEVQTLLPEKSGKFLLAKRNFPLHPSVATAGMEMLHA
jgi:hypothetical protein